jgi:hypothetical protein
LAGSWPELAEFLAKQANFADYSGYTVRTDRAPSLRPGLNLVEYPSRVIHAMSTNQLPPLAADAPIRFRDRVGVDDSFDNRSDRAVTATIASVKPNGGQRRGYNRV